MENLVHKCNICNIPYKTNSGLWKHNLKYHKSNNNINKLICKNCNKEFSYSHNRLRHEKKCNVNINSLLDNKIKIIFDKNNQTNNNIINSNNTINDNRKIIINYSPGTEPINHLTIKQQKDIIDQGFNSLLHLIKITNFDDKKPEYHSYCVTALNDKHASILDKNTIIKYAKHILLLLQCL